VVQGLSRAVAEARVPVEHLDDKVLSLRRNLVPVPCLELDFSLLVLEENLVDVRAREGRAPGQPVAMSKLGLT